MKYLDFYLIYTMKHLSFFLPFIVLLSFMGCRESNPMDKMVIEVDSVDMNRFKSYIADTIIETNLRLVALMDTLHEHVHTDSFPSLSPEDEMEWMNKYRNQLCNYYDTYHLGADTLSAYAKADTVIEEARRLWNLDTDGSTMGLIIHNGVEYTRLMFQHYNEYAQLLDLCKTTEEKDLLKKEFKAWDDLASLIITIYDDCTTLAYWGGSIIGVIISEGKLQILKSHITLYRKEKAILQDNDSKKDKGIFVKCAQDLLIDCCQQTPEEYIYEVDEYDGKERYQEWINKTRKDIEALPPILDKWVNARKSWSDKMDTSWSGKRFNNNTSGVLVELASIISSIQ